MELAGIGKWGIPENRFTYNAQSEKQKDLNGGKGYFYETDFRGYDPQLGRFKQYEPLADLFSGISPYQYAFNNPIGFNDPTGLCPTCGEGQAAQEGEEEGPQEQTGIQSKGIAQVSASDISGSGATLQTVDIPTGDTPGGENHKFSDNSGIWAGWDNGSWVKGNVTTPVANPKEWFRGGETTYLPGLAISTTRPSKLEKFVRGTLFFLLDFTPIPDAYTLVTGKDLETGEESSRLAAGAWLVGSFFGGKILKVAGKLVGKAARLLGIGRRLCFVAGTLILTADGHEKIEDIKEGDLVWAYNEETGKTELKKVVQTIKKQAERLVAVYVAGEKIEATPEHPFYVKGKGWIEAGKLMKGDSVLTFQTYYFAVDSLILKDTLVAVYNFEVEDLHNYFISKINLLVHNGVCGNWGGIVSHGQKAIDHIWDLHSHQNRRAAKFYFSGAYNTKGKIKTLVNDALKMGDSSDLINQTDGSKYIEVIMDDFIGVDRDGRKTRIITIILESDNQIRNAFPGSLY